MPKNKKITTSEPPLAEDNKNADQKQEEHGEDSEDMHNGEEPDQDLVIAENEEEKLARQLAEAAKQHAKKAKRPVFNGEARSRIEELLAKKEMEELLGEKLDAGWNR